MIYGDPLMVRRMVCGHPLAARAIRDFDGVMFTACWACEVESELRARAHARDYNSPSGRSAEPNSMAPDARLSATTREAGVVAYRGRSSNA